MIQYNFTLADISLLPREWKLLPINGKKQPIDPITGKMHAKWQQTDYSADEINSMESDHVQAVGVQTGSRSRLLVIDFDGPKAEKTFVGSFGKEADQLPKTLMNTSGKPGSHKYFYRIPSNYHGPVRTKHLEALDILGDGAQAVLLGVHPETGSYRWVPGHGLGETEIADAPPWVLERLTKSEVITPKPAKTAFTKIDGGYAPEDLDWGFFEIEPENSVEVETARKVLRRIPAKECEQYSRWIKVGMCLHSVGPSLLKDWIEWSSEMSNFDERECYTKWASFKSPDNLAKEKGVKALTVATLIEISNRFGLPPEKTDEELQSDLKKKDTRIPALLEILRRKGFRFNDLKRRIELHGQALTTDPRSYYVELALEQREELPRDLVKDCLIKIARENRFNPIEEYLEGISHLASSTPPIDDSELDAWFGLDDDDWVSRDLIRVHLRACAIRGMEPGSKMDSVLILAGPMGYRKSSAIKALAPSPSDYDETPRIDIDNRDTLSAMNSAFIIELSEIEKLVMSYDSSVVKAWVTRQSDNYVEKYESVVTEHPRRCCLFGTTNTTTFLNDSTGARRYWIVYNEKVCDIDDLVANRDRLWAHSLFEARNGKPYYLKQDDKLMLAAAKRGDDATVSDPWTELLARKLGGCKPNHFIETGAIFAIIDGFKMISEKTQNPTNYLIILEQALGSRKPADFRRLSAVMQSLGWQRGKNAYHRGYIKL